MFEKLFNKDKQESEEEALKRIEAKRQLGQGEKAVKSAEEALEGLSEDEIEAGLERARKGREMREEGYGDRKAA